ncbi:alpha/beta hydrolase [Pseudooceanicola sediminis]|uniref:Alpha/beta hydrolase n=2 Tax=Pseudooceanicola sediminis TaxID=2211117 RepID=A0A399J8A4_9RHOB|nr:alpha/beta hydrolase [Puniceibacterium sp. HSS470]RII38876.1 alpha/beta hydrolase [Pseudooceanicola sediminis]|tara:strand:- start:6761 stop:7522 length:762 start_codon:yes stop_codon:yes gene_type:complete
MTTLATPDPVILIHGAWQGSWAWEGLMPYLRRAGIEAHAIDLPGNGVDGRAPQEVTLADALAQIGARITAIGRPVSLVGHSGGGVIASAAAEAFCEQVSRIAYVAGMMLPSGMTFGALQASLKGQPGYGAGITEHLIWSDAGQVSTVPAAAAREIFFHDCAPEAAEAAAGRLTPQGDGLRSIAATLTEGRFATLPRLYVALRRDRSVTPLAQARMQALVPGARTVALDTGHVPQLADPAALSAALVPFLRGES